MILAARNKPLAAVLVMAIGSALAFAPLLPVALCVKHGPDYVDREEVPSGISNEDIVTILRAVRDHEDFGHSFEATHPRLISLVEYMFVYERIGILSLRSSESFGEGVAVIHVGITCGGLCGGGEIFCAREVGFDWEVEFCGIWVS